MTIDGIQVTEMIEIHKKTKRAETDSLLRRLLGTVEVQLRAEPQAIRRKTRAILALSWLNIRAVSSYFWLIYA